MSYEAAMMKEIKRRGWSTSHMSNAQYRQVGLAVRNMPQKVQAVSSLVSARARVKSGKVVPLPVLQEREAKCASNVCKVHVEKPVEACLACSCSGDDLDTKRKDTLSSCPKGLWTTYREPH